MNEHNDGKIIMETEWYRQKKRKGILSAVVKVGERTMEFKSLAAAHDACLERLHQIMSNVVVEDY